MTRGRLPAAAAAAVFLAAVWPAPALRDAATHAPVHFAQLETPPAYLIGAPLFGLWDTLTLLTWPSQHVAVLASLALIYLLRRIFARRGRGGFVRRAAAEVLRAVLALICLVAFYVGGVLLPRPMTGLRLDEPEFVAVDFHSHTNHSHDEASRVVGEVDLGLFDPLLAPLFDRWPTFTVAANRSWHQDAGFGAAYVTDHYTWAGVDDATASNPVRAGAAGHTLLLSGVELRLRDRHTNALGGRERYVFALDSTWHHLDADSLAADQARGGRPPTLLHILVRGRPLGEVVAFGPESPAGAVGIELSNGGLELEQVRAERSEILALADSLDLAVVAGSNQHGWSRTAVAWSVMDVPGWRDMTPRRMEDAIEAVLHEERREAVVVVERRMPYHDGSYVLMAITLPWVLWEHFRVLAPPERISWLAWAVVAVLIAHVVPRREHPDGAERRAGRAGRPDSRRR